VGFYRRATLVLQPRFDAKQAVELMVKEKVNIFAGVPTMYWGLLTDDTSAEDIAAIKENLRVAVSGGSALPMEVLKGIKQKFDVDVLEGYGLSETSPVASFNRPDRPSKPGSIGLPVWGVEMKLIDDDWKEIEGEGPGEIAIRGHNIMKGYYGRPEATESSIRDGWFRTGDVARRDEDGYYYIIDRSKDMIIRGGYNVYPRELEEVLMTHPDVSLAAVVGVEHPSHGEEIKAYVIRGPGASVTEDELVAWGKEQFANYKYPRIVEFRDELPMTATGKILKRELR
jgi:long-chain acyl-CoA synthetase